MVLLYSKDRRLDKLKNLLPLDPFVNNDGIPFNILVYQNYGIGDMVQYLRYIPIFRKSFEGKLGLLIKGNFYEPWVQVAAEPPSLKWIITSNYGSYLDEVIIDGWNSVSSEYNYKVEFMELITHCGRGIIPPDMWKKYTKYPLTEPINVGYCLAGSKGHPNDKHRSIEKIHFSKFINTFKDKVNFIDLSQENLQNQFSIVNIEDTISIIQSLDLVITVDTLIAHLAGYNNIPIFLLHGNVNDDRWYKYNKEWYNNVTHFYRGKTNEWGNLINTNLTETFSDWWENYIDKTTKKLSESEKRN